MIQYLWRQRRNLLTLIVGDFTQSYLASYLGFAWAIVGPLVMLVVMSTVFQLGFRVQPVNTIGTPFVAWLTCGMIPWLYFAEGLTSGAGVVSSYAFLVRKAMFRIGLLPGIRMASIGIVHLCLMIFLMAVLAYFGITPCSFWLQWFYYVVMMYLFLLGAAWLTSAVSVFVPDIAGVLSIITNIGFRATPIFWNSDMLPERFHWIFTLNPAYYLVQGYRDTFIEHRWLWERPLSEHLAFFIWLFIVGGLGALTFKRLRPHFADAL